ncbi:hypothetical protein ACIQPQ_35730 [Streptomyces sp. NPDC091281]|uniref:hypothetical protein n=1 Tax=Streptomyces sp. NPDC091281 TaxID=3365985 RepID=UPI003818689C
MAAGSPSERHEARRSPRSTAGKLLLGSGFLVVATTTVLGAYAGAALLLGLADLAPLSSLAPDDGRGALVVGGVGAGGLTGLALPLLVLASARGTTDRPRTPWPRAGFRALGLLAADVWLVLVALAVTQLGWLLPQQLTTTVAVFAVGFSWTPLAVAPWEGTALGRRLGLRGPGTASGSDEPD